MGKLYGYARISRKTQNIDRQIRNINDYALKNGKVVDVMYREAYTGTKMEGRKEFKKLRNIVRAGDTIVFDSVSRMSRNAQEGIEQYFEWLDNGVNIVFLKERHIDTDAYKEALKRTGINIDQDTSTTEGKLVKDILEAIDRFMREKAKDDIYKAFDQSQKEVDDLHERTKEGMLTARLAGKQIGRPKGSKETNKAIRAKKIIMQYSEEFNGNLSDTNVMKIAEISRGTYYKYKKELKEM